MNSNKPYLVDAIIGNSSMLASLGRTGRLYRLWWPHIDMPQHVDAMRTGIRYDDGRLAWFDEGRAGSGGRAAPPESEGGIGHRSAHFHSVDGERSGARQSDCSQSVDREPGDGPTDACGGWEHSCSYVERTNHVRIVATSDAEPLSAESLHFAVPEQNLLVRSYVFTNRGSSPISFRFFVHSAFLISENALYNTTMFHPEADALIHFRHRYFFALSSANVCASYQAGLSWENAQVGECNGNNIDMRGDGAMEWAIDSLAPGCSATVPLYIAAGHNEAEVLTELRRAKAQSPEHWAAYSERYWSDYLEKANPCPLEDEEIRALYDRSLLVFKLMADTSGSIIAAPEFDEHFSRCGGYAYCWGRDAAFITAALDRAGLYDLSKAFYDWTLKSQSLDGSWQQRHYHDGSLAPSWGLQIDEGASILWGMRQHYLVKRDDNFARKAWPAVKRGASFLISFIDEASGLPRPSIDLWEEREASHAYSSAAVCGGLSAAAGFAELAGEPALAEQWRAAAERIAVAIDEQCWNPESGRYYRGLHLTVGRERYEEAVLAGMPASVEQLGKGYERYVLAYDDVPDISLLGLSVPFGAVSPGSEKMRKTADAVEAALTVPSVGGIKRYADDTYIGGNPWILTTLWLAHYRIAVGQLDKARSLLNWAMKHRTEAGLLPEQIDKTTGETAWVVPLTWSHAMFVLTVWLLKEAESTPSAAAGMELVKPAKA